MSSSVSRTRAVVLGALVLVAACEGEHADPGTPLAQTATGADESDAGRSECKTPDAVYYRRTPRQCSTNQWNLAGPPREGYEQLPGELAQVASYYEGLGIELRAVGFAVLVAGQGACLACERCPRPDDLVVEAGRSQAAKLEESGFEPLAPDVGARLVLHPL